MSGQLDSDEESWVSARELRRREERAREMAEVEYWLNHSAAAFTAAKQEGWDWYLSTTSDVAGVDRHEPRWPRGGSRRFYE